MRTAAKYFYPPTLLDEYNLNIAATSIAPTSLKQQDTYHAKIHII